MNAVSCAADPEREPTTREGFGLTPPRAHLYACVCERVEGCARGSFQNKSERTRY